MKPSEIFQKVLSVVAEHTEISEAQILSTCRTYEVVDARCIAIHYWKQYGLETTYLMQQLNRKHHNSILHLYNLFNDRQKASRYFRTQVTIIGQQLANELPTSGL